MGMGRRPQDRQREFWIASEALASVPKHIFYDKLNELLDEAGFDASVEQLCEPFYAEGGRPGIPPGRYFRMLFVAYFEELDSQREAASRGGLLEGRAWRCANSLSLRHFLFLEASEESPDHSSLTRIRERLRKKGSRPRISNGFAMSFLAWSIQVTNDSMTESNSNVGSAEWPDQTRSGRQATGCLALSSFRRTEWKAE